MNLLRYDNFAEDAEIVRNAVILGGFSSERGPDGALYTGISQYPVPHWPERIAKLRGEPIIPRLSCFRINLAGELPHSWIHSDDICAKWASVLYLNLPKQCMGGTSFWKHRKLGIDRLPTREELGSDTDRFYNQMTKDWKDANLWAQTSHVDMKFNRFITYPTCYFHSRYPFEGFGTDGSDGRLIWICFYDLEGQS